MAQKNTSISIQQQLDTIAEVYASLQQKVAQVDSTLSQHTEALKTKTLNYLNALQKKIRSAERRKYTMEQQQIMRIKETLFPAGSLQERVDNIAYYFGSYGASFIDTLVLHSPSMPSAFSLLATDNETSCEE